MDRAADLLAERDLTVREVAQRVGYRQPAQFAKAFRRRHGSAPSMFRSQARFAAARGSRSGGRRTRPRSPRDAPRASIRARAPRRRARQHPLTSLRVVPARR